MKVVIFSSQFFFTTEFALETPWQKRVTALSKFCDSSAAAASSSLFQYPKGILCQNLVIAKLLKANTILVLVVLSFPLFSDKHGLSTYVAAVRKSQLAAVPPQGLLIKTALYANDMKNCLRDNHSRLNGLDYTKLWRSSSTKHEQFFTREKENWLLYIVHSAQHTQYICIWWWVSGKIENMSIYSGFFNVFLKCILNDTLTILRLHYSSLIFCWQGCCFRTRNSEVQLL